MTHFFRLDLDLPKVSGLTSFFLQVLQKVSGLTFSFTGLLCGDCTSFHLILFSVLKYLSVASKWLSCQFVPKIGFAHLEQKINFDLDLLDLRYDTLVRLSPPGRRAILFLTS